MPQDKRKPSLTLLEGGRTSHDERLRAIDDKMKQWDGELVAYDNRLIRYDDDLVAYDPMPALMRPHRPATFWPWVRLLTIMTDAVVLLYVVTGALAISAVGGIVLGYCLTILVEALLAINESRRMDQS